MTNNGIVYNFLWKFAERCGVQGVSFIVTIFLSRILLPLDYGIIAISMTVIALLNIFVDSGLGQALIQKKDTDNVDFSTVFWINLLICVLLYIFLILISPFIEIFMNMQNLSEVINVLGLILIISGLKNVQEAYVYKNMLFRKFFTATFGATALSAIVGIYMAYAGYGVWSLASQQLVNTTVSTVLLWLIVPWRPQLNISKKRLDSLFSYGSKLLVSYLINGVYVQSWQIIIGKIYSPTDLAYFNQGQKFPNTIISNISQSIDSVLFPTLSKVQNDVENVRALTRKAIRVSVFIIAPLQMGLAFCADNIVTVLLTEKWLPCAPFFSVFCINYMFTPLHTANLNAIKAMGRSDIFLRLEVFRKSIAIVVLLYTMQYDVMTMTYGLLIGEICGQIINTYPNKKMIGYSYLQQLKDIFPSISLAIFMGMCIYSVNMLQLSTIITLYIQFAVGFIIYFSIAYICKMMPLVYIIEKIKEFKK